MEKYDIIFESDNIYYIKMSELLITDYLKMYTNQEIQKKLFKKTYTNEQILTWIKKQLLDKNACVFSMIEKETNDFIGNAEIIRADNNIGKIIISVTPLKQDKHYGTETIKSIIKYGYENIKLDGFELNVYKSNHKAIHCYKKLDFTLVDNGYTNEDILMKHKRKM